MAKFKNLLQHQTYFSNELVCIQYLEQERWKGKVVCPHCNGEKHYRVKTRFKHPDLKDYKDYVCANKECRKKFTPLTGTLYECSKLSLRVWFTAMYLIMRKKSISSLQLSRDLGVSPKTAWFILHRLRELAREHQSASMEGTVQADETFIGGKNKNRHADKKVKNSQGRSFKDKTPVAGILQASQYEYYFCEKSGRVKRIVIMPSSVICKVVPDTKVDSIQSFIKANVKPGSILVSDEWHAYNGLNSAYDHRVVDHGRSQYVNENGDTSNAIESHWSHVKRNVIGIYHYISRKHMQRYCAEFDFRHNHRLNSECERFEMLVERSTTRRLMYKDLMRA